MNSSPNKNQKHCKGLFLKILSFKNQKAFDFVNRIGVKFKSPFFILVAAKLDEHDHGHLNVLGSQGMSYLGLKVSKKLGGAVERNFLKRRFRSIMLELTKELDIIDTGVLIVPYARSADADYQLLKEKVKQGIIYATNSKKRSDSAG